MGLLADHFRRVQAAKQAALSASPTATDAEAQGRTQYERMLLLLDTHQQQLRNLQSMEARAAMKAKLLPQYDAYLTGVLKAEQSAQDDVLVTLMLWHFDCADVDGALDLAEAAVRNEMVMPQQHRRTLATVVVEETADLLLDGKGAETPEKAMGIIMRVTTIVGDLDMPDQVKAKLFKAEGRAAVANGAPPEEAILPFKRALELHENVGVKKDIEQLERAIKNAAKKAEADNEGAG